MHLGRGRRWMEQVGWMRGQQIARTALSSTGQAAAAECMESGSQPGSAGKMAGTESETSERIVATKSRSREHDQARRAAVHTW